MLPLPVEIADIPCARPILTSPDPHLHRRSLRASATVTSPEPVSMAVVAPATSMRISPEPDLARTASKTPVAVWSADPVLVASADPVGSATLQWRWPSRRPRKPLRRWAMKQIGRASGRERGGQYVGKQG